MSQKKCATCGKLKEIDQFSWRSKIKGKRWGTCKTCQSKQRKEWYKKNRETHIQNTRKNKLRAERIARQFVWDYLSQRPCIDCGETDPVVLEFDHVKGKKKANITDMAHAGCKTETIAKEISKCVVRCANCHRRKTSKQRGWFRG